MTESSGTAPLWLSLSLFAKSLMQHLNQGIMDKGRVAHHLLEETRSRQFVQCLPHPAWIECLVA
ncbi:hypothetical protein [uncultured Cardiobacterium sp.]|uniref:hypothetical protein n=1 Tax=uncultured Cardiobacterium sp. TaxID=417619 RepID=UPI00261009A1|nr:hypothetical protein [uncultured Cardiobacterium sp.]